MTSQTHQQEVPELVERLDRVLAMDAQTATDREWSDLLAVALDCRETLTKAVHPVEGDLREAVVAAIRKALKDQRIALSFQWQATSEKDLDFALGFLADEIRSRLALATTPVPVDASGVGEIAEQHAREVLIDECRYEDAFGSMALKTGADVSIHSRHVVRSMIRFHNERSTIDAALATPAPVAGNALDAGTVTPLLSFADSEAAGSAMYDRWKEMSGREPPLDRDDAAWPDLFRFGYETIRALHGQSAGKPVGVE